MAYTQCTRVLRQPAEAIFAAMLDVASWSSFRGYGPIPGIRVARFLERTPELVGSRIAVENLDGSSHVERIAVWRPPHAIEMRMTELSPPLSRLATQIVETWRFEATPGGTRATRAFELQPRGVAGRIVLPAIAFLLGRAAARHLRELDGGGSPGT